MLPSIMNCTQENLEGFKSRLIAAGWQLERVVLPKGGYTAEWQLPVHKDS